jgi:hypothetical protein
MNALLEKIKASPVLARVVPFVVFLVLTSCQDAFGPVGRYWFYLAKTLVGAWFLWVIWPVVTEMRWRVSWEALVVGALVFVVWVGLDDLLVKLGFPNSYPKMKVSGGPWNPHDQFGAGSALAWFFIGVRILGSTFVVPPLEEVFFRSFVYRYLAKADARTFRSVPLGEFYWTPFLVTSIFFGAEHIEWLAGILAGFAYQSLVCWKKRLDDAITAHALTNLLLGLWVVGKGAWHFW